MESGFLLILVVITFLGIIKIYSEVKLISLHLEKIYARIDENAKIAEEAHKHTLEEKRKSGR